MQDVTSHERPIYLTVYYIRGTQPKHWGKRYALSDPPTSGHARALLIKGEKRSTLFCPFDMSAYEVPNNCGELDRSIELEYDSEEMANLIRRRWKLFAEQGVPRDFAVAALVLSRLGYESPTIVTPEQAERTPRGKAQEGPLRPVRRSSRRGAVVEFFHEKGFRSLLEAVAVLDMTRSGVLSHLFVLNRDHGFGYAVRGDCAQLEVPEDFVVFEDEENSRGDGPAPKMSTGSGKPADPSAWRPIARQTKRADIYRAFEHGAMIETVAETLSLTRGAVMSHLHSLHKFHGIGHCWDDRGHVHVVLPENCSREGPWVSEEEEADSWLD